MRIDSHQHFWRYNALDYPWMSEPLSKLRRDFLPQDLACELAQAGLDGSVAVQASQTLEETHWLLQLAKENPFIKGVVGWVDLRSAQVEEQLGSFSCNRLFRGVRHVVQDEPDDRFLLQPDFLRGIACLEQHHLTYDLLLYPRQLPAAIELVERFPRQPFVLDHLAKPLIRQQQLSPWAEEIRALARFPNVCCKISGLVTEADWVGWKQEDFTPYLATVFEAFGPERLLYGSDWPVCGLAASYAQVYDLAGQALSAAFSPAQCEGILGGNAERFYGLKE